MHENMTAESLRGLIAEFAAMGIHRTGWPADDRASAWIAAWLVSRGIPAALLPFTFPKVECHAAFVDVGDIRIAGTPLYDGGATGPAGITAPLTAGDAGGTGKLVLLDQEAISDLHAEPALAAGGAQAMGAIAISGDPEGFVVLRNAERMAAPLAWPVLQVAARDAGPLRAAAAAGRAVTLVIDRSVVESTASNVAADIVTPGADGLVVLMTPKSGWFTCAAERGGGVAITMALAAAAAAMPGRRRNLRVLFSAGHELGHWGLMRYLEQQPQLRGQASLWVHLGASIGAAQCDATRLFSRESAWRDWFMPVLARHGAAPVTLMDAERRPGGESREIFERPFVSMAGHHRYFHSPQDLPEVAVDAARVARFGSAFHELLQKALRA